MKKSTPPPLEIRHPLRVVVAEDHILLRDLMVQFLTGRPERFKLVGEVSSLEEALSLGIKAQADLLLVRFALFLPGCETAIAQLRERLPEIRILPYSGFDTHPEQVVRAVRAGSSGFVGKTIDSRSFLAGLDRLAHGHNFFCEESTRILTDLAAGRGQVGDKRSPLSPRETEILRYIASGLTSKQIADSLGLSVATIDTHRRNMMFKLRAHNTADLIRHGYENHLLDSNRAPEGAEPRRG